MFPWAYYGYGAHFGAGWWLFMLGGMLIPLAILVLVVWLLFRAFKGWQGPAGTNQAEDPINVLKVRYARGDITREEYERMREELKT